MPYGDLGIPLLLGRGGMESLEGAACLSAASFPLLPNADISSVAAWLCFAFSKQMFKHSEGHLWQIKGLPSLLCTCFQSLLCG